MFHEIVNVRTSCLHEVKILHNKNLNTTTPQIKARPNILVQSDLVIRTPDNPTSTLSDKGTRETNLHGHCVFVTDNLIVMLVRQKPVGQTWSE